MIRFENVSKMYRGQQQEVVRNITMGVPQGEIVVLIGPSGCGKTTCLKMINRLIKITSGKIFIDGEDIMAADPIELRRRMGYVIQQTGLFPHMTVQQNIEIIPTLQRADKDAIAKRTRELMKMVGLDADEYLERYPTQLSGGQLQRVGVARAFATDPEIILMDEPFSALDPITRGQLQDELLFLQSNLKKTIVFVTHDMDEAIKIADRIAILNNGELVQYDTPEKILKEPANEYVAQFVGANRLWNNPEYIRAEDIMMTSPATAPADLPIFKAMEIMRESRSDSIIILDSAKRFLGVVAARTIAEREDKQLPCRAIMESALTAPPHKDLVWLLGKFEETKARSIPVVDADGRLLGLVTMSGVVTVMSQQLHQQEVTAHV